MSEVQIIAQRIYSFLQCNYLYTLLDLPTFFLLFISSYLSLYDSIRYHTTVKARFCFQAAGSFVISLFFFQDELFLYISKVMQRYGSLDPDHVLI